MLLAIRERVMGVVGWILLALLFIAFSFFGLNAYFQSDARIYAAMVNDTEIALPEHQRAYQLMRNRLQDMMGQNYNPALIEEAVLKKNSLEQLIREELLLQEAAAEGFAISSQLVAAQINAVDSFRDNGAFSREKYERALRLQGMGPAQFEWRLARELMTKQIVSGVVQTAGATSDELGEAYRLQGQQRRFKYLTLPVTRFMDKVEVSDADIEQYYEAHGSEFMTPERVKIQYLELKADDLQVPGEPDEDALRALYEEHSERYVTEEERQARHILISLPPDSDAEATAQTREKAQAVISRLEQGEAFEALAKELSDDPGSAAKGGDLGSFTRGIMTPAFDEAAFSLEQGGRSGVVRSPFGFHIIEVTDMKAEIVKPFEDVRAELVQEFQAQEQSDLFYDKSEILANLAFEQPDSLQGAADALDTEVQTSDWLTRAGGAGIGERPEVVSAAFQEEVLESGNNSEPIELGDDHLVVIRMLEHEAADRKPLADVREEVATQVHTEKARELARTEGEKLLGDLKSGTPLAELGGVEDLEVKETGLLDRRAVEPDRALIREAYLLPPPADGRPSITGIALGSGDYVIIALDEVKDGDITELSDAERENATQELSQVMGASEIAVLVDELKNRATIIIPEQSN